MPVNGAASRGDAAERANSVDTEWSTRSAIFRCLPRQAGSRLVECAKTSPVTTLILPLPEAHQRTTMHDFEYEAPQSLANTIQLLAEHNGSAKPLAGGTDLIDHVRTRRLTPDVVVDIKKLPELNVLEIGDGLRLGAAVPCYKIYGNETIVRDYSALADSCRIIGGIQIQSRASVGGNLCNSGPAADSIPSLIALGATAVIGGPNGTREVAVEDFCTAPGKNVLQAGELLVELKFPSRPAQSGSHYRRFIPRNEMDIAVVGVGASVELDEKCETFVSARVALAAVACHTVICSGHRRRTGRSAGERCDNQQGG